MQVARPGLRLVVSHTDVASISWSLGEHYFTAAQVAEMHSILLDVSLPASDPRAWRWRHVLYRIGRSSRYHKASHDITTGTNGYPAAPAWDPVTGWGTPNGQVLIPLLAHLTAARHSRITQSARRLCAEAFVTPCLRGTGLRERSRIVTAFQQPWIGWTAVLGLVQGSSELGNELGAWYLGLQKRGCLPDRADFGGRQPRCRLLFALS
jgi:hypothetical protein